MKMVDEITQLGNNDEEEEKEESYRLPKVSKKDDKVGISGFRRTKTNHFK